MQDGPAVAHDEPSTGEPGTGQAPRTSGSPPPVWTTFAGIGMAVLAAVLPGGWAKTACMASALGLMGMNIWSGTRRQRWWAVVVLAGVFACYVLWAMPHDLLVHEASPVPLAPVAEVEAMVVPGGESMVVHPADSPFGGSFIACFYDGDRVVAAAHECEFPESRWELCLKCLASNLVDGVPTFEAGTPYGVVISGVKCPDGGRQPLSIAGPEDIRVGQTATTLLTGQSEQELEVVGYIQRKEGQFLVVRMLSSGQRISPGLSGAPIVQDGKIIGFLAGRPGWDFSHRIGLARLAADVYAATMGYR